MNVLFAELAIESIPAENNAFETKDDVYEAYSKVCKARGLPQESSTTFSRDFKNLGYDYYQKKIKGINDLVLQNIQLIDWKKVEEDQESLEICYSF